jgi:hypothetical protein
VESHDPRVVEGHPVADAPPTVVAADVETIEAQSARHRLPTNFRKDPGPCSEVALPSLPSLQWAHDAPVGSVGKGGVALSPTRDEGMARSFDDLARGLESNAISRAKLIKLGGAALVASALGLFASADPAEAEPVEAARRRRHHRDCCIRLRRIRIIGILVPFPGCHVCCRRRRVACCGRHGCHCCRRGHCHEGRCRRHR